MDSNEKASLPAPFRVTRTREKRRGAQHRCSSREQEMMMMNALPLLCGTSLLLVYSLVCVCVCVHRDLDI